VKTFEPDQNLEQMLALKRSDESRFNALPELTRRKLDDYDQVKAEQFLPASTRPKRRRFFESADKADFIAKHGGEKYLALPW
jgi:hypothetical protein